MCGAIKTATKIKWIAIIITTMKTIMEKKNTRCLFAQFGPTVTYSGGESNPPFHYINLVTLHKIPKTGLQELAFKPNSTLFPNLFS
jgi:hypothetical protein